MRGHTRHRIHLCALIAAVLVLVVILCIGRVAEIVIIAAFLAYLLDPVVTTIEEKGCTRVTATVLIMLLLASVFALFWYTVIPIAIDQIRALQSGTGVSPTSKAISSLDSLMKERLGFLGMEDISLTVEFSRLKSGIVQRIPRFLVQDSLALIIALVMIPFIMFFILKDGREFKKYFINLVPNRYFEFTLNLMYKMETQMGNYLRGQFLDAMFFGVLATAALWILKVPYFVVIGIFAGFANLIPFVGPVAGALAALIAVILEQGDIGRAAYVLLAFALLKLADDFVIQPLTVGKHVNLHPMVVAIAIIVGGHLFGILGMLFVVPLLGFLKVVLEEGITTYRRYQLD